MIDWMAFLTVAVVTLVAALAVVALYSGGVRLYAISVDERDPRTRAARLAAYACFIVCAIAVAYGIYLIVPAFHPKG